MYNLYEVIFLIKPEVSKSILKGIIAEFYNEVKKNGKNVLIKVIQNKQFAWNCKKYSHGYLIYHQFISHASVIEYYENNLNILETCLLKQIIRIKRNAKYDEYHNIDVDSYSIITNSDNCSFIKDIT